MIKIRKSRAEKADKIAFDLWMALWSTAWITAVGAAVHFAFYKFGLIDLNWNEVLAFAFGAFCGGYALVGFRNEENNGE